SSAQRHYSDLREPRNRLLGPTDAPLRARRGHEDRARRAMTKDALPFPESLCHRCAAPPRYVKTKTSTFILCPVLENKYPPQPALRCPMFVPRSEDEEKDQDDED